MNSPAARNDAAFDAQARALHDDALAHLSPRVQAQLAQRRRVASKGVSTHSLRGLLPWMGMATATVALMLVMQLRTPSPTAGSAMMQVTQVSPPVRSVASVQSGAPGDDDSLLSEDPEFYLWLAADGRPANVE